MKKVILFVVAAFLTTMAFSQNLVKTQTKEGIKYVEKGVDLKNTDSHQELIVLGKPGEESKSIESKKSKIILSTSKWRTPKDQRPEEWFEARAYDTEKLLETIEKNKEKYFAKEIYEENGTYYILFYPIK
jgi:hypothetical protein